MTDSPASSDNENSPPATRGDATGRFGPPAPPNVNVQVNAQNLHINPSNLAALERIVQLNPDVAIELVRVSGKAARHDSLRYAVGAICAAGVCITLLGCAAATIIYSGFWAGIAFFLACVVAAAIIAAVFTGKVQDLSWTANVIPGARRSKPEPPETPEQP